MSNPYRDALLDLYTWADRISSSYQRTADVMHRTRILLTQPEPLLPTGDELDKMVPAYYRDDEFLYYREGLAAGLRWAQAAPQPEPPELTDEEIEEWADASDEAPLESFDPDSRLWKRVFSSEEFCATVRAAIAADRARR